jgi:hypothetical protein
MILNAIIDQEVYTLNVPDAVIDQAGDFFAQLDRDMDHGWQMSREWVDNPDRFQRCQIIADKLLTALDKENEKLGMLMAGYILARLPNVESVELDVQGEIQNNLFRFHEGAAATGADTPEAPAAGDTVATAPQPEAPSAAARGAMPSGLDKMQAMSQAGRDVTQVFKVGKGYRFSVFDHATGSWQDAPLAASEPEAERLRQEAFKARYQALQKP